MSQLHYTREQNLKKFRKTASLLLALSLIYTTGSAAKLRVNYGADKRMSVEGTDFTSGTVSITVAHSSQGDVYSFDTKFSAIAELTPDMSGNISFASALPADAMSGYYTVAAYDASGEIKESFFFVNETKAKAALDRLSGKITSAEAMSVFNENVEELGIADDLADPAVNAQTLARLFVQFKPSVALSGTEFTSCWLGAMLCGGKKYSKDEFFSVIENNAEALGCSDSPFMSLDDDEKAAVHSQLSKLEISSSSFADALIEAAFVTSVNKEGITRKEFEKFIMEEYADFLELDTDDYKGLKSPDKVISALMKKTYISAEDFKDSFNVEVAAQKKAEKGSNTGGGGGGGISSSGSYDAVPVVPGSESGIITEPDTNEKPVAEAVFADMANHWAKEAVMALKNKGIVSGVGDNLFAPDNKLSRAEFAKIISESFFADYPKAEASYSDVSSGDWFAPYVYKLAELGVINGRGDGTFAPYEAITRQDAAVIMYRTAKLVGVTLEAVREQADFDDKISDYAKEAVDTLYRAQLINGMSALCFDAFSNVTRAQAAQLVYNMMQ